MNDCYTPYTGEHIATDTPADWMARAGIDAPAYDKATQGCFFQGGAWAVIDSAKAENPRIAEIKADLSALDFKRIRPLAEGDTEYLTTINAQAVALRAELTALTAA